MMTRDVMVTIAGFHMADEDEDTIEMVHIGEYYERNGAHYILYEERMEGMEKPVKNMIKVQEHRIELKKKGPVTVNMVFEENKSRSSIYAIPYGSFLIETHTTKVGFQTEAESLLATASYELKVNGARCADCDIRILVQSRETFRL